MVFSKSNKSINKDFLLTIHNFETFHQIITLKQDLAFDLISNLKRRNFLCWKNDV